MAGQSYGLWGHLSFGWVDSPIKKARKNELELENLYLPAATEAQKCYSEFETAWTRNTAPEAKKMKDPLLSTLWGLYGRSFLVGGFFKLGWSFFVISGAFFFVRSLLLYVDEDENDHPFAEDWTGWPLAIGFFVASVLWGTIILSPDCCSWIESHGCRRLRWEGVGVFRCYHGATCGPSPR